MQHRYDVDAAAGPAREGVIGGRAIMLVRVRLFDGPGVINAQTGEPAGGEDVCTDLRPAEARALAAQLIACAERAEQLTAHAGGWQR
jgi:hypothetical protein